MKCETDRIVNHTSNEDARVVFPRCCRGEAAAVGVDVCVTKPNVCDVLCLEPSLGVVLLSLVFIFRTASTDNPGDFE